jgi:hypothetical protein
MSVSGPRHAGRNDLLGMGMVMACVETGVAAPFEENPFHLLGGMSIPRGRRG